MIILYALKVLFNANVPVITSRWLLHFFCHFVTREHCFYIFHVYVHDLILSNKKLVEQNTIFWYF